jgi:hypothetical protein
MLSKISAMLFSALICAIAALGVHAAGVCPGQIKHIFTFGDSYTDIVATGGFSPSVVRSLSVLRTAHHLMAPADHLHDDGMSLDVCNGSS